MALVIFPVVGFILYLFLGQSFSKQKMFRIKKEEDQRLQGIIRIAGGGTAVGRAPPSGSSSRVPAPLQRMVLMLLENNGAILTANNRVRVFTDGKEKFASLLAGYPGGDRLRPPGVFHLEGRRDRQRHARRPHRTRPRRRRGPPALRRARVRRPAPALLRRVPRGRREGGVLLPLVPAVPATSGTITGITGRSPSSTERPPISAGTTSGTITWAWTRSGATGGTPRSGYRATPSSPPRFGSSWTGTMRHRRTGLSTSPRYFPRSPRRARGSPSRSSPAGRTPGSTRSRRSTSR